VQDVLVELQVPDFTIGDLHVARHGMKEELEQQLFFLIAGGEKVLHVVIGIGNETSVGGKDISLRIGLATLLPFLIRNVLTACMML